MTVVVTGSSGFIGSHLCNALLDGGEELVGIDRVPSTRVPTIRTDLAAPSPEALDALAGAEAVWHLAARPGIRDRGRGIEAQRHRDNVVAAANVLNAVPLHTALVVTSSSSVYGGSRHAGIERPSRESDPLRPQGGYASSKVAMERLCGSAPHDVAGSRLHVLSPLRGPANDPTWRSQPGSNPFAQERT